MSKHFTKGDEDLKSFMIDYDVKIDQDMFKAFFAYDVKGVFTSPTFETVIEVVSWLKTNMKSLERKLN